MILTNQRKLRALYIATIILAVFFCINIAFSEVSYAYNAQNARDSSILIAIWAMILLLLLLSMALISGGETAREGLKKALYGAIVVVVLFPSIYFIAATIYVNIQSETGGPVHWHADFRIIACGTEYVAPAASGLSNRVGNTIVHEHADRRIHVEGTLIDLSEASLSQFFEEEGGRLNARSFTIPHGETFTTIKNGDACLDGTKGIWQVYVYQTREGVATQKKIADYENYVLSPYTSIPDGDCIIIEYGPEKSRTDKICNLYEIEKEKGNLEIR